MNVDIRDQLLAEGFRQEQLLKEDWETMKKELADLYVAGKITERQIQTRLSRAGMGPVAAHAAHKIAVDNAQQREANIAKAKEAQERLERAREITTRRPGPKRGELAQAYCNEWNKKFGHIVKAGVVRESLKNAFENINVVCEDKYIDDYFVNLCEEVNIIGDTKMTEKELTKIFEDTLTEAFSLEKIKKAAKKTALGVAAAGALTAAPGVVAGVKNVGEQRDARAMDKAGAQYNKAYDKAQNDARRAEMEKKIRDAGIQVGKDAKNAAADLKGRAEMEAPFVKKDAKDLANKTKEFVKNDIARRKTGIKDALTVMKLQKNGEITPQEARAMLKEIKKNKGKKSIMQVNEEVELIEEEVSVNKVEKRLAKMKKLLNKPRNVADSSFRDFSASEKEKMLSLIAEVEKVLARKPKTKEELEKFQEDLKSTFKRFNAHSKSCKEFRAISWWFLPLGFIPSLTRLYSRLLRNLSNERPLREAVNYFPY